MSTTGAPTETVPQEIATISKKVRNWGRWGDDDELGTLNLISAQKRASAGRLVERGAVFPLGVPFDDRGPQSGRTQRKNPQHLMTRSGGDPASANGMGGTSAYNDDMIVMHLQCGSQWDALSHVYYDGKLYNGYAASEVDSRGAHKCSIDKVHDKLVSRAVLLDVARVNGTTTLPAGHAIRADELDAACAAAQTEIEEGDIVLIRTGLMADHHATGSWARFDGGQPGLHYDTATWFHERGVAAVAADNTAVEQMEALPGVRCPMHMLALVDMGMPFGEYWDFEALATDCAADGRYTMLLAAQALRITRAVGSPVSPIAMK